MEAVMDRVAVADLSSHFNAISRYVPLRPVRTEADYDKAVLSLNALLDAGAADEAHPLADLAATLGELIADYDDTHYPAKDIEPKDLLRFLMEQHGLTQNELPEIGSQGVVSEVLSGKRLMNVRQLQAVASRFKVSAAAFLG